MGECCVLNEAGRQPEYREKWNSCHKKRKNKWQYLQFTSKEKRSTAVEVSFQAKYSSKWFCKWQIWKRYVFSFNTWVLYTENLNLLETIYTLN